jgi:hypothetical protein
MQKLELTDLFPETGMFTLRATGDHVHKLRPVSLADHAWLEQNLGGKEAVEKAFSTQDLHALSRLVFHLLEDKTPFAAEEVEEWSEDGELLGTKKVGGAAKLRAFIRGTSEQIAVLHALLTTIGISQPILEKLEKEIDQADAAEKKRVAQNLIGKKSSTASKRSTATRTAKSAR